MLDSNHVELKKLVDDDALTWRYFGRDELCLELASLGASILVNKTHLNLVAAVVVGE